MPTLNWIGKDAVVNHHKQVPFRLLKCNEKLSVPPLPRGEGRGEGENLLIQGDNLEALKALLPYYAGQVKCIYIDPPYNTGNEGWVYNDNVNSPEMRDWLGKVVGGEAEDLSRHDKWLSMMFPRLVLLRELLSDDGSIFVNIDDNEQADLRLVLNEVFGTQNFVATVIWQKVYSPRMDAKSFSNDHDSIVVYQKTEKFSVKKILFEQNTGQFTYFDSTKGKYYRRRQWRKEGSGARREDRPNLFYSIVAPDGTEVLPFRPDGSEGRWRGDIHYFKELENAGATEWVEGNNGWQIYVKQFYEENASRPPSTLWFHEEVGHNHEAAEELRNIFGQIPFQTPKPTRLIRRILQIATNPGDLILDSFAGSGTTGHAVLQMNKDDGGNRRFILVEIDKNIAENITAERLKRVIQGYTYKDQKGNKKKEEGLGGGFRYCELGGTLFDANGQIDEEVKSGDLAQHVYFIETGQPLPDPSPRPPSRSGKGEQRGLGPLLGVHNGTAVYLLYNGILKDKKANGGNVLTRALLRSLPRHDGPKIIYGTGCLLSEEKLQELGITFRQIPYEVKAS